jgi:hypothetical protein
MCGRYRLSRRKQLVEEYFDTADWQDDWSPRYNVAPTQPVPVIRQNPKEPIRELSLMKWGLIPSWILLANPLRCDRRSFTDGNNNEVARRRDWRCSCLGSGLHDRRDRFHHLLPTRVIGGLLLVAGGSDPIVLGMLIVFSLLPL